MRTLIVLRHAKSAWPPGVPDLLRPLNDRGRRDAPAAGRHLADAGLQPDRALVSPGVRTRQTWELASAELPTAVPVVIADGIYGADWTDLLDVARSADPSDATVVLVGHNPGCEELVEQLAGPGSDPQSLAQVGDKYPTCGIAVLEIPGGWAQLAPGSGVLRSFAVPRG